MRKLRSNIKPNYKKWDRCPQCGGFVVNDGVRFGVSANIQRCVQCGLTDESLTWFDAKFDVRRPIDGKRGKG
jgi:transcription elongation factor Elf1